MQIEGTKLIFIVNFSVLDYSNLPPECLKLHKINFQYFPKGMPPDPPKHFLFLSLAIPSSVIRNILASNLTNLTLTLLASPQYVIQTWPCHSASFKEAGPSW